MNSGFPSREQVVAIIEEHVPPRVRQLLIDNLAPAIALVLEASSDEEIAVGASKIGGAPDVPDGFEWPQWNEKPLGFLAQFRLEEVATLDVENALPSSGLLSFFYAIEAQPWGFAGDEGGWRVFYWEDVAVLKRRELSSLSDRNRLPMHAVSLAIKWQLPDSFELLMLTGVDVEQDENFGRWNLEQHFVGSNAEGCHHLLGLANNVQDPPAMECCKIVNGLQIGEDEDITEYYSDLWRGEGGKWRLLFQLDSHFTGAPPRRCPWMWGDAGMIYFCLHRDDLKNRNFDKVWLQLQCF